MQEFVASERAEHSVYPPHDEVFAALHLTQHSDTKVMVLGQDPYHGAGQAPRPRLLGPPRCAHPALVAEHTQPNCTTTSAIAIPNHGNLECWARQGVLLLNTTLTVRAGQAASHQKRGWEEFTDQVIKTVNDKTEPVVFILWGKAARRKSEFIDLRRHTVIESPHPSPFSARSGFFGSKPFSRANAALIAAGRGPISWRVDDLVDQAPQPTD